MTVARSQKKSFLSSMFFLTNLREGIDSLRSAKQRTIIALVGIIVGIGSVIALISIGAIVKKQSILQFQDLGTDIMTIRQLKRGLTVGLETFELEDIAQLTNQTRSVVKAAPWLDAGGNFIFRGEELGMGRLIGVTASYADLQKLKIAEGRFVSDLDFRRRFCVVGHDFAQKIRLAGAREVIGESMKVLGHTCDIIGVLAYTEPRFELKANLSIFVPITTAMSITSPPEVNNIVARMNPNVHYSVAEEDIKAFFKLRDENLRVEVISAKQIIEQIQKQLQLSTLLLAAVGSISLFVGGVGVMNVMLSSVNERRKEIGVRRALGARRRDIQFQFLIESLILSIFGGLLGIALGTLGSFVVSNVAGWDFFLSYVGIVLGVGVASAVGIFFGFIPAFQASRTDPIAALRST